MARTNKYTSINFNDIYEKQLSSSAIKSGSSRPSTAPSSSSSSSPYASLSSHNAAASNYKSHLTQGRMLVLSRPAPKPIAVAPPPSSPLPVPDQPRDEPDADPISLRPLGRTGAGSPLPCPVPVLERDKEVVSSLTSPKPDKFVPPHLRPGFTGREERPEVPKQAAPRGREREPVHRQQQQQQGPYGSPSPGRYGEDQMGRPKSGGYDRMMRDGESDLSRGSSFGTRPSSRGWYDPLQLITAKTITYDSFVIISSANRCY
ncbi:hypothetical protein CRG98_022958 [Punica granatum]|uniref:Uncharacterized protein n=1 Tax=Punica granatum TaxID=22663 RepID=A0A2I0JM97_PUNGR|nr:hypothetical protein CRG98_022958 [Punica granatum]